MNNATSSLSTGCQLSADFKLFDIPFSGLIESKTINGNRSFRIAAFTERISLLELAEKVLKTDLPDELPDCVIENLLLDYRGASDFKIKGSVNLKGVAGNKSVSIGSASLDILTLDFVYQESSGRTDAAITVHGNPELGIIPGMTFHSFKLAFSWTRNAKTKTTPAQNWVLGGTISATILERTFLLQASYTANSNGQKTLLLRYVDASECPFINVADVFVLTCDSLELRSDTDRVTGTAWKLSAAGSLAIGTIIRIKGTLSLSCLDKTVCFSFRPEDAVFTLPLLSVDTDNGKICVALTLRFGPVAISLGPNGFAFSGLVTLVCKELVGSLPAIFRERFPEEITAKLDIGNNAVRLTVDRILAPAIITLPPLRLNQDIEILLGDMCFDLSNFEVEFSRYGIGASVWAGLGLPSELNRNLGTRIVDGKDVPVFDVIRTFNKSDIDHTIIRARLAIGTDGLKVTLIDSPVKIFAFDRPDLNGAIWCTFDAGDIGAFKFKVPDIKLDAAGGCFSADGGMEVIRDLALPLSPVKSLLQQMNLGALATILPDKIPLMEITFLDENDKFNADGFIDFIEKATGINLPEELEKAIEVITCYFNNLPDRLRAYFNIRLPKSFLFNISITPDMGVKFKVGVKPGDPPICLLYPSVNQFGIPELTGMEFYSLSFGEAMSGSLLVLELDCIADTFDLISIAAGLLLMNIDGMPLTPPAKLHRRILIRELFMLIVYQTGIPIPLPIFFKEIGVEYLGLEGIELELHLGFPMPKANFASLGKAIPEFISFVTDKDALLDPKALGDMDPRLIVGKNYIALPSYLGGKYLGTKTGIYLPGAYETFALCLNTIKKFSLAKAIRAIPLDYRVGEGAFVLGPVKLSAKWLLSTPAEFAGGLAKEGFRTPEDRSQLMRILPGTASPQKQLSEDEEGMVLFLRGRCDIAPKGVAGDIATLELLFGIAASPGLGFNMGFGLRGSLLNLLDMEARGVIAVCSTKALDQPSGGPIKKRPAATPVFFRGKGEYVTLPELSSDFSRGLSIEWWMNHGTEPSGGTILHIGNRSALFSITIVLNKHSRALEIEITAKDAVEKIIVEGYCRRDVWIHTALTIDPHGNIAIYGDDVCISSRQSSIALPPAVNCTDNRLGCLPSDSDRFTGALTDVRIWNIALSRSVITARSAKKLMGNEENLIGWWPVHSDEHEKSYEIVWRSVTQATDAGFALQLGKPEFRAAGLMFDGTTGAYLSIANPFQNPSEFTIGFRIRPKKAGHKKRREIMGSPGSQNPDWAMPALRLARDGTTLEYAAQSENGEVVTGTIPYFLSDAEEWTQVYWVKRKNVFLFHRDGKLVHSAPAPERHALSEGAYRIGTIDDDRMFVGCLDEIQFWNYGLSQYDIDTFGNDFLSGNEPGLVCYLPFKEGKGGNTIDVVSGEHIEVGAAQWVDPAPLRLFGIGCIDDTSSTMIRFDEKTITACDRSFTLEFWLKPSHEVKEPQFILAIESETHRIVEFLWLPATHSASILFYNDNESIDYSATPLIENDFYHFALVKSKATVSLFSRDRLLFTAVTNFPAGEALSRLRIGSTGQITTEVSTFAGIVAELRLWGVALTTDRISRCLSAELEGTESGLLGYWPFREGTGDVSFDLAGSQHAELAYAKWNLPNTFDLNGIVFSRKTSIFDAGPEALPRNAFTFEAWIYGQKGTILSRESADNLAVNICWSFDGELVLTDSKGETVNIPGDGIPIDRWAHIALVVGRRRVRILIDGMSVVDRKIGHPLAKSDKPLIIGNRLTSPSYERLSGKLDEVRIWNYEKDDSEIKSLIYKHLNGAEYGLVAYWPCHEGKGIRAFDIAGRNNALLTDIQWDERQLIKLTGKMFFGPSDAIEVSCAATYGDDFTLSLWVNPSEMNTRQQGIIGRKSGETTPCNPSLSIGADNGTLLYELYTLTGKPFRGSFENFFEQPDRWIHIAWVKKGDFSILLRNGREIARATVSGKMRIEAGVWSIGKVDSHFKGRLDEICLWNYARSERSINQDSTCRLSGKERGLIGYWPFINRAGKSPAQGSEKTAETHPEVPNASTALTLEGITFSGENDHVELGVIPDFQETFTVELWVKGSAGTLFQRGHSTVDIGFFRIEYNRQIEYTDNQGILHVLTLTDMPEDAWTHLAIVCDKSVFSVYCNGNLHATLTGEGALPFSKNESFLGKPRKDAPGTDFSGSIDDFRFWSQARTKLDIARDLQARLGGSEEGLELYLPFEEGMGNRSVDLCGRNNAYFRGTTWNIASVIEMEGVLFNGSSTSINCGTAMTPQKRRWTIEFWLLFDGTDAKTYPVFSQEGVYSLSVAQNALRLKVNASTVIEADEFIIEKGEWIHVAILYNGQYLRLYKNGERIFSAERTLLLGESDKPLYIGREGDSYFKGQLHSFRIWNGERTVIDLMRDRRRQLTGTEENLVGCWDLLAAARDPFVNRAARTIAQLQLPTAVGDAGTDRDVSASGDVFMSDSSNSAFIIAGESRLKLFNHEVFGGAILVRDDLFAFKGTLSLFPPASALQISGNIRGIIDKKQFLFEGNINASIGKMTITGAYLHFSRNGFVMRGRFFDQSIMLLLEKKGDDRFTLSGGLEKPIIFGDVFAITNAGDGKTGPFMSISGPKEPGMKISGEVTVLGISSATDLSLNQDRFELLLKGNLWGVFGCELYLSGENIADLATLFLRIEFKNGIDAIARQFEAEIARLSRSASNALQYAQDELSRAKVVLSDRYDKEIAELKRVAAEKAAIYKTANETLRTQLDTFNREVERCWSAVNDKQNELNGQSKEFSRKIDLATREIEKTQSDVNGLLSEIGNTERWYNSLPSVGWPWKANKSRDWVWVGPKLSGLYSSYGMATLALSGAKLFLDEINKLQRTIVGELATIIASFRDAYQNAVSLRQRTQDEINHLIDTTPDWVKNPDIIGVTFVYTVSQRMLDLANEFLSVADLAVREMNRICRQLLDAIPLQITYARFEGLLGTAATKSFNVFMTLDYFDLAKNGRTQKSITVNVDFGNIPQTASNLLAELMPSLPFQFKAIDDRRVEYETQKTDAKK